MLATLIGAGGEEPRRNWSWPIDPPVITSPFGQRRGARRHPGVDLDGETGDLVRPAASGHVRAAGWYYGYGRRIEIDHGRCRTIYAHLDTIRVAEGDRVDRSSIIGTVGDSGNATGSHLHFEVILDGRRVDPEDVVRSPSNPCLTRKESRR